MRPWLFKFEAYVHICQKVTVNRSPPLHCLNWKEDTPSALLSWMVSMCKYAVDWYSKVDDALILGKTHFFVSTSVLSDWLVGDLKLCQSTSVYPEKKTSTPDNLARNIVSLSSHHKYLLRLPTDNPLVFIDCTAIKPASLSHTQLFLECSSWTGKFEQCTCTW